MAVLAVVGLLGYGLIAKGGDPEIEVGKPLATTSLPYLAGASPEDAASVKSASLADYRGNWVLLNFWASWCTPCRDEAPALESFFRKHKGDGLVVLGVDSQDNTEDAAAFVKDVGLTYPSLRDGSGSYHDDLNMSGYPESVLVESRRATSPTTSQVPSPRRRSTSW